MEPNLCNSSSDESDFKLSSDGLTVCDFNVSAESFMKQHELLAKENVRLLLLSKEIKQQATDNEDDSTKNIFESTAAKPVKVIKNSAPAKLPRKKVSKKCSVDKQCPTSSVVIDLENPSHDDDDKRHKQLMHRLDQLSQSVKELADSPKKPTRKRCLRSSKRNRKKERSNQSEAPPPEVVVLSSSSSDSPTPKQDDHLTKSNTIFKADLNPLVSVRISWQCKNIKTFRVRKFEKLDVIIDHYQQISGKDPKLITFTLDEKEINLKRNSYHTLNLTSVSIIEGGILPDKYLLMDQHRQYDDEKEEGVKVFKMQFSSAKNGMFNAIIRPGDDINVLFGQIIGEIKTSPDNFKLYFDGQRVTLENNLTDLELEGDECFDIVVDS